MHRARACSLLCALLPGPTAKETNMSRYAICLIVPLAAALAATPGMAARYEATAVLERAERAMGADRVKTIRYAGNGSGASFGQAYKPGMAWPKLNLPSYARLADYENAAFREEIVRSRAEPKGGGLVPLAGEHRLTQSLAGAFAWNQLGPAPAPAMVQVAPRVHDLWTTPHGVLKAARKHNASLRFRTLGGREYAVVSFTDPGRYSATAFINEDYLVERVESRMPQPVLGDTRVVSVYEGYRDFDGVRFPTRIKQSMGGFPVLELAVTEVKPNVPADIQVPVNVRAFAERVTAEKAADGVWYLAGGSHHSVAIEMKNHLIVVESPLYDARSAPMLEAARKLAPGKPVRYVVNSHSHFDHSGGLRTAAAEGATLVVQRQSKAYFRKVLANPNRISPDALAKSGRKAKLLAVGAKHVFSDGTRTVELHHIKGSIHADTFLMAYLPKERLLIQADAFTPGAPPASPPNANNVNLVDNIARLKLQVERILPLHGRIVPVAELYKVAGKAP
jgi:glyoxylase-like metal-dependent hydrolase (beta-lactamase superfamily II)